MQVTLRTFLPKTFWAVASASIYLEPPPGILETFSATIISPTQRKFDGVLMPGFCPHFPKSIEQGDHRIFPRSLTVQRLIQQAVQDFEDYPDSLVAHRTGTGANLFTYSETFTDATSNTSSVKRSKIVPSFHMLVAIGLSVALGVCCSEPDHLPIYLTW